MKLPHPYTNEDAKWWTTFTKQQEIILGSRLNFAIRSKTENDLLIGGIGIKEISVVSGVADIGYWLAKSHWGKDIMPRVLDAFCQHILELNKSGVAPFSYIRSLNADIFVDNKRSERVLTKCGFKYVKTSKNHYEKDGVSIDAALYTWDLNAPRSLDLFATTTTSTSSTEIAATGTSNYRHSRYITNNKSIEEFVQSYDASVEEKKAEQFLRHYMNHDSNVFDIRRTPNTNDIGHCKSSTDFSIFFFILGSLNELEKSGQFEAIACILELCTLSRLETTLTESSFNYSDYIDYDSDGEGGHEVTYYLYDSFTIFKKLVDFASDMDSFLEFMVRLLKQVGGISADNDNMSDDRADDIDSMLSGSWIQCTCPGIPTGKLIFVNV